MIRRDPGMSLQQVLHDQFADASLSGHTPLRLHPHNSLVDRAVLKPAELRLCSPKRTKILRSLQCVIASLVQPCIFYLVHITSVLSAGGPMSMIENACSVSNSNPKVR